MKTRVCSVCKTPKPLRQFPWKIKAKGLRSYKCKLCTSEYTKTHRKEYNRLYRQRERREIRAEVLAAYGGRCQCRGCDVTQPEFLAIDHIKGNGAEQRKQLGGSSGAMYIWLKKHGFPKDDYRLLCHNCNQARAHYGACPHEMSRSAVAS